MAAPPIDRRTVSVPEALRAYVLRELRSWGTGTASRRLGLSPRAALRVAAGLPVMPGTLALVREAMRGDPTVREAETDDGEEKWEPAG